MSKYRVKPFEVEATQWFRAGDHPSVWPGYNGFFVLTRQGAMRVDPGDWIITPPCPGGVYPCKPDVFTAQYGAVVEEVDGPEPEPEPGDSAVVDALWDSPRRLVPGLPSLPEPVRRVLHDFANIEYAVSTIGRFKRETDTAALFLGGRATIQDLCDFRDWVHGLEDRVQTLERMVSELEEEVGREVDEENA